MLLSKFLIEFEAILSKTGSVGGVCRGGSVVEAFITKSRYNIIKWVANKMYSPANLVEWINSLLDAALDCTIVLLLDSDTLGAGTFALKMMLFLVCSMHPFCYVIL